MTIGTGARLVKDMKMTSGQINHLVDLIFQHWKKQNILVFKQDEKKVYQRAVELLQGELQKEVALEKEVNAMLDQLERTNSGEFQRYKMYPILKAKLAKERKVIL